MWYMTKYALTDGIVEIDSESARLSDSENYVAVSTDGSYKQYFAIGRDITTTSKMQSIVQMTCETKNRISQKAASQA